MSLADFRESLLDAVLEMLWAHWTTLGVLARARLIQKWPVDPEALVVATIFFGRYDPRLFDAFIEWWAENSQWISSTRLQRIARSLSDEDRNVLTAVAESVLLQQNGQRWQRLLSGVRKKTDLVQTPLFRLKNDSPLPMVGTPDPNFLNRGFLRPRLERRRVVEAVDPHRLGNLRIRLRGLFGLTSRAEILLFLLAHDLGHARLIARQTHYAYAPVTRATKQMTVAGFLTERRMGREVEYALRRNNEWAEVLHLPQRPIWIEWVRLFEAIRMVFSCLVDLEARNPTEAILGPELYRCTMSANRLIIESELPFSFREMAKGLQGYVRLFEQDLRRLFKRLGGQLEV